jgi:predicted alpha/beta-hydrolase family hydrolase
MVRNPYNPGVMDIERASNPDAPLLVLAHGAGAGATHPWMRAVARELAGRGVSVVTFDFPYITQQRRVPDRAPVLESAFQSAWLDGLKLAASTGRPPRACFAGGKSMGGRIASQLAARKGFSPGVRGLVFFGYPLHPPGKPEQRRDAHLPSVDVPMLFLHGTRDPFGSSEEFGELLTRLPAAGIYSVEGGDHSLRTPKRSSDPAAFEHALDAAAEWIHRTAARSPIDSEPAR